MTRLEAVNLATGIGLDKVANVTLDFLHVGVARGAIIVAHLVGLVR